MPSGKIARAEKSRFHQGHFFNVSPKNHDSCSIFTRERFLVSKTKWKINIFNFENKFLFTITIINFNVSRVILIKFLKIETKHVSDQ